MNGLEWLLSSTVIGAIIGGAVSVTLAVLNQRWKRQDKHDALLEAVKVLLVDRIRYLGQCYISAGEIELDDKENLHHMYKAYKGLGGNGELDPVMEEVDKLKIVTKVHSA